MDNETTKNHTDHVTPRGAVASGTQGKRPAGSSAQTIQKMPTPAEVKRAKATGEMQRPAQDRPAPPRAASPAAAKQAKPPQKAQRTASWLIAVIGVLLVLLVIWGIKYYSFLQEKARVDAQWAQYEEQLLNQEGLIHGITIDGIYVGGLTREEAVRRLEAAHQPFIDSASVTVRYEDKSYTVDTGIVPVEFNTKELVNQAYEMGRKGERDARLSDIRAALSEGIVLESTHRFDVSPIADYVAKLAEEINQEPKDAQVVAFRPHPARGEERFEFAPGQDGLVLDEPALTSALTDAFEQEQFGSNIQAVVGRTPHTLTLEMLQGATELIATSTTEATNSANRNQNIELCSTSFDGRIVMPGEVFSINEATGPRTTSKGYRPAGAIIGGILQDEPGGGVCQVSGTLYNSVLKADLEILERYHHSWPSSYMPKALDASINYGTADFRFKNNRETPIYLVREFKNRRLTISIYGAPLTNNERIELHSEVIATVPAPEPRIVVNPNLKPGEKNKKKTSMAGYTVNAFRTFYDKDGNKLRTEKLYTDVYAPQTGIIEVGPEAPPVDVPVDGTNNPPSATPQPTPQPNPNEVPPLEEPPQG